MIATVVGTRYIHFVDAKSGQTIAGTKIHCVMDSVDDEGVCGQLTDSVFVRDGSGFILPEFKFGAKYNFEFQQVRFGGKPVLVGIMPWTKDI